MRLYKAYNSIVSIQDDVLVFWADGLEEAKERASELLSDDYIQYTYDDSTINEVLEMVKGNESKALELMGKDDRRGLAKLAFLSRDCDEWTFEEIGCPAVNHRLVYACYPKDIMEHEDVEIVILEQDFGEESNLENVMSELACRESVRPNFRGFVNDKAINMSFNERFYCDRQGYIFEPGLPFRLRESLFAKIGFNVTKIDSFLDEFWLKNVNEFFKEQPIFGKTFIKYITSDSEEEPNFSNGFYYFIAKKLLDEKDWTEYDIREIEMPLSEVKS